MSLTNDKIKSVSSTNKRRHPPVHLDKHISQFSSSSIQLRQDISYEKHRLLTAFNQYAIRIYHLKNGGHL